MSELRQSDYRAFGMLRSSGSAADPDVLARAVRNHKAGDAFAQVALTLALVAAICAVTFVLSADRAAASELISSAHSATQSQGWGVVSLLGMCTVGVLAAVGLGQMRQAEFHAQFRQQPARIRRDNP